MSGSVAMMMNLGAYSNSLADQVLQKQKGPEGKKQLLKITADGYGFLDNGRIQYVLQGKQVAGYRLAALKECASQWHRGCGA